MKIKLLQGIEGAKKATGISVIIDVFRAFTVEAYLMNNGAKKIIPVGDIKTAYQYKKDHSQYLLIGERNGKQQVGFDYGNSPTQIASVDVEGKTIIHTTSSGTQGIVNAVNAEEILTGSLVNAKAIATYIKRKNPQEVSLVSMGLAGRKETEEDTLCANYIKSLLEDKELDITKEIESLKLTSGSKFFKKELQDIFPEQDFFLATQLNKFNFILKVEKGQIPYIRKIDIKKENHMNEVIKNIMERRSIRKYQDKEVSDELIDEIVTAGTYAPSGRGKQPAIIIAIKNKEVRDKLSRINAKIMGTDIDPFYGAPVVLVVLADKSSRTYLYDGSLVMENMMLAASSLGLGSCWIHRAKEEFETEEGKELLKSLGIEGDYEGIGNCIIGYKAEEKEAAPRKEHYVYKI